MDGISEVAERYGLKVIEDCAQSHGAKYKGKMAGTFGHTGAFSFYPTKNLGALGDAGAIVTQDADLSTQLRVLRNYGSNKKYYNEVVGYNSRLDEVQAAFLITKLKSLDTINSHKRKLADIYHASLSDRFIKPMVEADSYDVYHIYNIRCDKRDELKAYLLEKGIATEIHYPVAPVRQKAMKGVIDEQDCPVSEEIHQTTLSLPISYFHSPADIEYVCKQVNSF
jgi:dTDP-4-amino-4,6-dideoxygalactose transaminase